MARPKLRRQNGKLKPHSRSHVTGRRFRLNLPALDRLQLRMKHLERQLRKEASK